MDNKQNEPGTKPVPDEIKGWSWGAFGLNGVWGLGNRTYIALLAFIPIVNVFIAITLGLHGRKWAWKNHNWESVEHFTRVQKKWDLAGKIVLVLYLLFFIAGFVNIIR